MKNFETEILSHLERVKVDTLWWSGDLYEICCKVTGRNFNNIHKNRTFFSKQLLKMEKRGLVSIRKIGTGYGGRADTGANSMNHYALPGFWLHPK